MKKVVLILIFILFSCGGNSEDTCSLDGKYNASYIHHFCMSMPDSTPLIGTHTITIKDNQLTIVDNEHGKWDIVFDLKSYFLNEAYTISSEVTKVIGGSFIANYKLSGDIYCDGSLFIVIYVDIDICVVFDEQIIFSEDMCEYPIFIEN